MGDTEWAGTGNSTRTIKHGKLHRPRRARACQQRNALNSNPSLQVTAPEVNNAGTLSRLASLVAVAATVDGAQLLSGNPAGSDVATLVAGVDAGRSH
jgi:hypothetical protein